MSPTTAPPQTASPPRHYLAGEKPVRGPRSNQETPPSAAVYGRDPNWGRIAAVAGYAGVSFQMDKLRISLGEFSLMESGQPLPFDRDGVSNNLKKAGEVHETVTIDLSVGEGAATGKAWGCDLSFHYVKINVEYTS